MSNREICELIFELIYNNLWASGNYRLDTALRNRFIGFRAELDFVKYLKDADKTFFNGGYLLPLRTNKSTVISPVYFTVTTGNLREYTPVYRELDKLNLSKLLLVRYDGRISIEDWTKEVFYNGLQFPVPLFECYDFQNNIFVNVSDNGTCFPVSGLFSPKPTKYIPSYLPSAGVKQQCIELIEQFDKTDLISIYVSRLVFDGFIGFNRWKGIPSDIDLILQTKKGGFVFAEIKEKDLSKTPPVGFGIDERRLDEIEYLRKNTGIPYVYFVRKINNQAERIFQQWKFIDFKTFKTQIVGQEQKNGGSGMNTLSTNNPTYVVEEKYFQEFKI